jgi:hypothetical protein
VTQQRHIRLDLVGRDLTTKGLRQKGREQLASIRLGLRGLHGLQRRLSLLRREIEMHARHIAADAAHLLALRRDDIARGHRGDR